MRKEVLKSLIAIKQSEILFDVMNGMWNCQSTVRRLSLSLVYILCRKMNSL